MELTHFIPPELYFSIGWTLLHSLWQYLLVASLLALISQFTQRFSGSFRYGMFSFGLLVCVLLSLITFLDYWAIAKEARLELFYNDILIANGVHLNMQAVVQDYLRTLNPWMKWIVLGWITGSLLLCLQELVGLFQFKARMLQDTHPTTNALENIFQKALGYFPNVKNVYLFESVSISSPITFGSIKKYIFIPLGLLSQLNPEQVELILLHELAHIKRHDFTIGLIQSFIKNLFFFNPALYWISRNIDLERENACDDIVVNLKNDASLYSTTLAEVANMTFKKGKALGIHNGNMNLLNRIKRLFNHHHKKPMETIMRIFGIFVLFGFTTTYASNNHGLSAKELKQAEDKIQSSSLTQDLPANAKKQAAVNFIAEFDATHFSSGIRDQSLINPNKIDGPIATITRYDNPTKVNLTLKIDQFKSVLDNTIDSLGVDHAITYKKDGYYFIVINRIDSDTNTPSIEDADKLVSTGRFFNKFFAKNNLDGYKKDFRVGPGDLTFRISANSLVIQLTENLLTYAKIHKASGDYSAYFNSAIVPGSPYAGAHKSAENEITITYDRKAWEQKISKHSNPSTTTQKEKSESTTTSNTEIPSELISMQLTEKQLDKLVDCFAKHWGVAPSPLREKLRARWNTQLVSLKSLPPSQAIERLIQQQKKFEFGMGNDQFWVNIYDDSNSSPQDPNGLNTCKK